LIASVIGIGVGNHHVQAEPLGDKQGTSMNIQTASFGKTKDGQEVQRFTITNRHGHSISLTNFGATLLDVNVPDREGKLANVNLCFETLDPYLQRHPYFGSTVGRFCNRIAKGQFTIDGKAYQVTLNAGKHHLHGGKVGFDQLLWSAKPYQKDDHAGVVFTVVSPDGDEGYPGQVTATADYRFSDADELTMTFAATTDAPTHVNLTNHSYWNLGGAGSGTALNHVMEIHADQSLDVDGDLIPTGKLNDLTGSNLDFRTPTAIGKRIAELPATKGYDHCYVVRGAAGTLRPAARITDPKSGRVMEVLTTQPGMQLYTANHLPGNEHSNGFGGHEAFCVETQHYPNAPNIATFPPTLLRPGQTMTETTVHRFSVQ
ncbi:MAG: aldose epimerase family protein, partial [Planctomycetaceae bacterium]